MQDFQAYHTTGRSVPYPSLHQLAPTFDEIYAWSASLSHISAHRPLSLRPRVGRHISLGPPQVLTASGSAVFLSNPYPGGSPHGLTSLAQRANVSRSGFGGARLRGWPAHPPAGTTNKSQNVPRCPPGPHSRQVPRPLHPPGLQFPEGAALRLPVPAAQGSLGVVVQMGCNALGPGLCGVLSGVWLDGLQVAESYMVHGPKGV